MTVETHKITEGVAGERQLRNRLGQLTREDRALGCYVGSTSDYRKRARQHEAQSPHFERMVVLFRTCDLEVARGVERDLIRHTEAKNANALPGGEGLRPGKRWYYVYVLLEPIPEETESLWPVALGLAGVAGLVALLFRGQQPQPR